MSRNLCSFKKCTNSANKVKGMRMFTFPKLPELCRKWVNSTGNHDLIGISPTKLYKNKRVCEKHLRKEDVLPSGRLKAGAVPIPYVEHSYIPTTSAHVKSPGPSLHLSQLSSPKIYSGNRLFIDQPTSSPAVSTSSAKFSVEQSPSVGRWIEIASPSLKQTSLGHARRNLFDSSSKSKSVKTRKNSETCSKHLAVKRAAISKLKRKVLNSNRIDKTANKLKLKFKTKDAATLFNMQFHRKRRPWSNEEKRFATILYLRSPSTYRYLSKSLILPGVSTVQKGLASKENFRTGFNKGLMIHLKTKSESMTPMEKACVLMFDEMAIKQYLEYSYQYDVVEGYHDAGRFGRKPLLGKQASVFMIRGLFYQWKLPVGYFVTEKGLIGSQAKVLVEDCIENLSEAGLSVKAIVCDQSSTNSKAYSELGVTTENPFFVTKNGDTIFTLFDTPHLLKSLRNNLLTHDLYYDGKVVSFADIRQLYNLETKSTTTRAAHHLTPAHIWPNNFQKMSVPLAAQVFSHTTAAALKTAVATGEINTPTCLWTADFLHQMNSVFDAMNSRKFKTPNPDSCCLSRQNRHVKECLENALKMFKSLKKLDAKCPRPPCFSGFVQTINAMLQLLQHEDCEYLLTSRLNQDPLENLFASLRQRGGWNRNPTVRIFRSTLRLFTLKHIMEPPKNTSYDPDADELLEMNFSPEYTAETAGAVEPAGSFLGECKSTSSSSTDSTELIGESVLTDPKPVSLEQCSQIYFAGYIAHNYNKRFRCNACLNIMCDTSSKLDSRKELLILNRSFSNVKVDQSSGLLAPSENLVHVVCVSLKVYRKLFKKIAHKACVISRLIKVTNTVVSLDSLTCFKCSDRSQYILQTLFRVLLFKQCKWTSDNLKSSALEKVKVLKHVQTKHTRHGLTI